MGKPIRQLDKLDEQAEREAIALYRQGKSSSGTQYKRLRQAFDDKQYCEYLFNRALGIR